MDAYRQQRAAFVESVHGLRDSLLHQRYENWPTQEEFVRMLPKGQPSRIVELLLEGRSVYEGYVTRMLASLGDRGNA